MHSIHLKRNGQDIIAVIKKDNKGAKDDAEDSSIVPYWIEGEDKPVLVETWIGGGSYSYREYVNVHEVIGNKYISYIGEFRYMFEEVPFDFPITLERKEYIK